MATYTLNLLIDSRVLAMQSPDNFCIARKLNDRYTTVFMDASIKPRRADQRPLMPNNSFSWQNEYKVFATTTYKHGLLVSGATNQQDIKFGQQTSYEKFAFGEAKPASTSDFENESGDRSSQDSFLVKDIPNNLHVSVMCKAGSSWVPIFVDPDQHSGLTNAQLTPTNEYILFWAGSVQTSSMIDESRFARPYNVKFDGGDKTKTVRFGYRKAENPEAGEQPDFYPS